MAASVVLPLIVLVVHFCARHVRGQDGPRVDDLVTRSCPTGFLVQSVHGGPGYFCVADPCYVSPCGPGNTCTSVYEYESINANCTCNAPYQGGFIAYPYPGYYSCYLPGQDVCNPNPCQNGGTCSYVSDAYGNPLVDAQGTKIDFICTCRPNWTGKTCELVPTPATVTATVNGISGPLARAVFPDFACNGQSIPPIACLFADNTHFICCDETSDCGPIGPDGVPVCPGPSYVPSPNVYPPASNPPSAGPNGDQGVCGTGAAAIFPNRCWFNNDPQGRYVCCDSQGCDGFNADNLTPHCANYGYVPPNDGLSGPVSPPSTPPSTPPTGDQGVCGTGNAAIFTTRCWFDSDPLGRYVCCDSQGCDGFNTDNLTPHCANYGYVPPNFGLSGGPSPPSTPPSTTPSGSQGVCGTGDAAYFPTRCWFNSDPQGRYVCCDSQGCDGFNADNLTPHCANFGYVPPGYGI